jgi:hypothetical protein
VTTRDEKRRAAVRDHERRNAVERKLKADAAASQQAHERQMRLAQETWMTRATPTIRAGVHASNEAFAHLGSKFVIGGANDTSPYSIAYKVVPSGRPTHIEASFSFILGGDTVCPETTAQGCDKFPGPVAVGDVTQDWVEDVADSVMDAVLRGQRMRIPD